MSLLVRLLFAVFTIYHQTHAFENEARPEAVDARNTQPPSLEDLKESNHSAEYSKTTKLISLLNTDVDNLYPIDDIRRPSPSQYAAGDPSSQLNILQRQQNQLNAVVEQLIGTEKFLENAINDAVSRKSYVTASTLRSFMAPVRRLRNSIERLQNRLQSLQSAASSGQASNILSSNNAAMGVLNTIRDRIATLGKQIRDFATFITRPASANTPKPANG